jgi:hypothetical protein
VSPEASIRLEFPPFDNRGIVRSERSQHVVLVTPPALEHAGQVWPLIRPPALVVCGDPEAAVQWATNAPSGMRAHAVTSLGRSAAVLRRGGIDLIAGTPADLAALLTRAALKLDAIQSVVLAWPEFLLGADPGVSAALDTLLAEVPEAPRVVLSWNPPALAELLERHARRAEVMGDLPLDPDGRPLGPVASARCAVVSPGRLPCAVTAWRDAVDPKQPYLWSGGPVEAGTCDAVLCTEIPTRAELQALAARGPVTVFATAGQLPYLRAIARVTPLSLGGPADRAQDRAEALRTQIAALLEGGNVDAELAILAPLFERFEPAEVAAALLKVSGGAAAQQPAAVSQQQAAPQGRTKIFVNIGKKDKAGPKDLVGALIREVGLEKDAIGKIDVRETFSVVEVAASEADRVVRGLSTVSIRNRRVLARLDRDH